MLIQKNKISRITQCPLLRKILYSSAQRNWPTSYVILSGSNTCIKINSATLCRTKNEIRETKCSICKVFVKAACLIMYCLFRAIAHLKVLQQIGMEQ
jgi:hypothetical protein